MRGIFLRTLTRMPMCVTRPISHGWDRLRTVPLPCQPPRSRRLSLRNHHIRDGHGYGIAHAIWAACIGGFGLMILMKTKITDQYYCCNSMGYDILCSQAIAVVEGNAQGVVGKVIMDRPQGWII